MFYKKIKKLVLSITVITTFFSIPINTYASSNPEYSPGKKVLIVGSYTFDDSWEDSVILGIKDFTQDNYIIKVNFLDSRTSNTSEYTESFIDLLQAKYKDFGIDYIITLDDEAFNAIYENINNPDLFIYNKKIIFAGVNDGMNLNDLSNSKNVSGVLDEVNELPLINLILDTNKKISDIYFIVDGSQYSQSIVRDIINKKENANRAFNYHVIEGYYENDVIKGIKDSNIDSKKSAICLIGNFKKDGDDEMVVASDMVKNIKSATKTPVYSTLKAYIDAGAIGGIVNDGENLGRLVGKMLDSLDHGKASYMTVPTFETFNIPYFNFKAIRQYNINPLKLPSNSVYINKKQYHMLLPTSYVILLWIMIVFIFSIFVYLVISFILHRRKVARQKILLSQSLEREKIKTDFIVTMSHELRTPINIIYNTSNLLMNKLKEDIIDKEYYKKRLNFINNASNRLNKYTNNLIDATKIELGFVDLVETNENIVEAVEEVFMGIVDFAESSNINVVFDTEEEEIYSIIDKGKLQRIILNLLSNSIKFTNSGGSIFVYIQKKGNFVLIDIEDNGIGIKEDLLNHIFEKFNRAEFENELTREYEGSGLGLSIVKGLLDVIQGQIDIKSKPGEGTKITLKIPIKEDNISDAKKNSTISNKTIERMVEIELSDVDKDIPDNDKQK